MNADWNDLIQQYVSGTISDADARALEQQLKSDAALRDAYLDAVNLDSGLEAAAHFADTLKNLSLLPATEASSEIAKRHSRRFSGRQLAVMAVLLVFVSLGLFVSRRSDDGVVRIAALEGSVRWTGGKGAVWERLPVGASLPGGLLETVSDDSTVFIVFKDGSVVTLFGLSSMALSDDGQKRVHLREGSMSASVKPQERTRPMLIRTAAAEAEIVGTEFSMSVGATDTSLRVDTGLVKLRRLTDGSVVEVGKDESAIASLDADREMTVSHVAPPPVRWRRTLEQPVPKDWRGQWLPADENLPARVMALPYAARKSTDGPPVIFHGISFRSETEGQRSFARLASGSAVQLRYRMSKPASLTVFVSCVNDNGGFGGNFESDALPSVSDELWREIEIPLAQFRSLTRHGLEQSEDMRVVLLLIHSGRSDAGLEIAEVSIRQ